jgi:hypothetical protein
MGIQGYQTDSVRVTVEPVELTLTADRTEVGRGDTVTFTGVITPPVAPYQVVGWSWEPDSPGGVVASRGQSSQPKVNYTAPAPFNVTLPNPGIPTATTPSAITDSSSTTSDTINARMDTELQLAEDEPLTEVCTHTELVCRMPVNGSGTVTLVVNAGGTPLSRSVHVAVKYYCPDDFDYSDDPIELFRTERFTYPGHVPLGVGPAYILGPYHKEEDHGVVPGDKYPSAYYNPSSGHDYDGGLLWIGHKYLTPTSVVLFECRQSLRWNPIKGEHELQGPMKFKGKVNLYFVQPRTLR